MGGLLGAAALRQEKLSTGSTDDEPAQ
jgi:hypothetical protein